MLGRPPKYKSDEERRAARHSQRRAERQRNEARRRRDRGKSREITGAPHCGHTWSVQCPPGAIEEAQRLRAIGHNSLTAELMGDPLPGRSALDHLKESQ